MTKTLPTVDFSETLIQGSAKKAIAESGATKGDMIMVPVEELLTLDGFNVRVTGTPDYEAHIEALTQSILADGFLPSKPLSVFVGEEKGEDGNKINLFYVTDGHCRLAAVKKAIAQGAEIKALPVVLHKPGTSMEDLTVGLIRNNSGRPLTPYEQAVVVGRLSRYGWTDAQIAERLGITTRYVKDHLALLGAPAAVRNMVINGKVAANVAVQVVREHGADAPAVLKDAMSKAEASGKTKVTAKALPKAKPKAKAKAKPKAEAEAEAEAEIKAEAEAETKIKAETENRPVITTEQFLCGAMDYAIETPKNQGLKWLASFRNGDAAAIAELESWLGQPAGSFADPSLRQPVAEDDLGL